MNHECKNNTELLKTKTILYIEDEDNIRDTLTSTLKLMCKEIFPSPDAKTAFKIFEHSKPDIILTDVSLGEMNGLDFIKKIRENNTKIPIIVLSAHTDTKFLLEASKLKLVEYLTKPITFQELQNVLILAIKELPQERNSFFYFNDTLKYDTSHKILYENGVTKKLSSSEATLLSFFIENKQRTIHTQEIKNHIWDDSYYATDTALKSLLHKLRTKIGKNYIKNVSGIGYYLEK